MQWVSEWQDYLFFCNWVHCVCVGPWPFNLFPVVLSLFLVQQEFYGPNYPKCSNLRTGPTASSFSQCPCRSRLSFSLSCCLSTNASELWFRGEPTLFLIQGRAYSVSDSGESLYCFLVGVNKSYVIATSDLWLCIHASNLLPSLPTPLPHILYAISETHNY